MDNSGTIRNLLLYRARLFGGVFVAGVIPGALLLTAGVTPPLVFALVLFGVALVPWTIGPAVWSPKPKPGDLLAQLETGIAEARARMERMDAEARARMQRMVTDLVVESGDEQATRGVQEKSDSDPKLFDDAQKNDSIPMLIARRTISLRLQRAQAAEELAESDSDPKLTYGELVSRRRFFADVCNVYHLQILLMIERKGAGSAAISLTEEVFMSFYRKLVSRGGEGLSSHASALNYLTSTASDLASKESWRRQAGTPPLDLIAPPRSLSDSLHYEAKDVVQLLARGVALDKALLQRWSQVLDSIEDVTEETTEKK